MTTEVKLPDITTIANFVIDKTDFAKQEEALLGQQRAGGKELWLPYDEIKVMAERNKRKKHNYFKSEEELESFALSLKAGQSEPGTVDALDIDGKVTYVLDHGNRRHMAYQWLDENGHGKLNMWVRLNSSKTTPEDRLFRMINSNGGKPFEDDELAEVLKELYNNGWTDVEKLSKKVCIPKSKVYQLLSFADENIAVKEAVSNGEVAMTTVMQMKGAIPNREQRTAAVTQAIKAKKETGSTKKVTAADIAPAIVDNKRLKKASALIDAIHADIALTEMSDNTWATLERIIRENY